MAELACGPDGVQTLVPIMLNHVNAGQLCARVANLMSPAPPIFMERSTRAGWRLADDFTIVDVKKQSGSKKMIVSPSGWTPFDGMAITGWPVATIVRGAIVMRDDEVQGEPTGKLVKFRG
jgi:dihydroorotase